jgi:LacI family transcriptional regulator
MPSIVEVAKRANVTPAVVSRVLNGDPTLRIKPETRARVLEVVRALNYRPNPAARALRKARTGMLGLVVHDITNPVYAEIVVGAQQAATDARYTLLLGDADALAPGEESLEDLLRSRRIDGLLLQRAGTASDNVLASRAPSRVPMVLLNDWANGDISSVALDDLAAARLAVGHLAGLGHTEIAHLAGADSHRARQRILGYQQVLARTGLAQRDGYVVAGGWDVATGRAAMARVLAARKRPTAVFVANTLAAVGALAAIREAGLAVPGDISIVSIHDVWVAEHLAVPLTTVRMPLAVMGRTAVKLLIEQIDGQPPQRVLVKEPEPVLVRRSSTAPPPGPSRRLLPRGPL